MSASSAPHILDLFAGCGGLSHGFQQAGFDIVAANDILKEAAQTHILNHPDSRFFLGDIRDETVRSAIVAHGQSVGVDVIVGGPPCQAYSLAGKRDVNDDRGRLFEDYVGMVDALRPKVFVMENVKGILSIQHDRENLTEAEQAEMDQYRHLEEERDALLLRRKQAANTDRFTFDLRDHVRLEDVKQALRRLEPARARLRERVTEQITRRFSEIGYRVEFQLLNAADYGVPQRRERVVFIGTRLDIPIVFPAPTHADPSKVQNLLRQNLKPWVTTAEAIEDLVCVDEDTAWSHEFTAHKPEFLERLEETPVGGNVYAGYSDAWYRQPPNEPSRTVKENHGGVFVHYAQARVMTPRELARLQSFPDDFRFAGKKSKVLVQIGNAVPPGLGQAIGEAVLQMLHTTPDSANTATKPLTTSSSGDGATEKAQLSLGI